MLDRQCFYLSFLIEIIDNKGLFLYIKNIISFCINSKLRIEQEKYVQFIPRNTDEIDRNHQIPLEVSNDEANKTRGKLSVFAHINTQKIIYT